WRCVYAIRLRGSGGEYPHQPGARSVWQDSGIQVLRRESGTSSSETSRRRVGLHSTGKMRHGRACPGHDFFATELERVACFGSVNRTARTQLSQSMVKNSDNETGKLAGR